MIFSEDHSIAGLLGSLLRADHGGVTRGRPPGGVDPARLQIVAGGDAATIAPLLSTHGPVSVYGADGKPKQ